MNNNDGDLVLLAHGDGGRLTHDLITGLFFKHFGNRMLAELTDAAWIASDSQDIAVTTDSFVIDPLFFPGGDIGKLAVCGTVNDLAVSGADPLYLTVAFMIEEGFPLSDLEKIVFAMGETCREAGVQVIAGDTKVVGRGQVDKLFINTTGIGTVPSRITLGYDCIQDGDVLLINGNLGEHGVAVLGAREGFNFTSGVKSDCAALHGITRSLREAIGSEVRLMRDLTRGGFATSAKEVAVSAGVDIWLDESLIPVSAPVHGACEILGLDPLYLANEGKFLAVVSLEKAQKALEVMRTHPLGENTRIVGEVARGRGEVFLKTILGGTKYLDLLTGEPLPRIC